MKVSALRKWSWVHKWSSLVCTVFLLMLCITGLPLIFHHEIDDLLHEEIKPAAKKGGTLPANLDLLTTNALAKAPDQFIQFLIWDRDEPDVVIASVGKAADSNPEDNRNLRMDRNTGNYLDEPDTKGRLTYFLLKLHVDLFAGLPGKLFLGLMGILFVVAVVSGIVVYGPSMRKVEFGTVRTRRATLLKWLDIHNLLGAVTITWVLIVGTTGVINTWAELVIKVWQYGQLGEMVGQYKDRPRPQALASVEAAVATASAKLPDMTPSFVAYPGSLFSSKSHYAVFMRGNTPLTARMLKPVLIDAADGAFVDSRDMPWYVSTLLLSQPLHFGDYGGMPLKIIWHCWTSEPSLFSAAAFISGSRRPRKVESFGAAQPAPRVS